MKLELYKPYKTRGGWKAVVVDQLDDDIVWVWHNKDKTARPHHSATGSPNYKPSYDIIDEWHKPRQWDVWIAIEEREEGLAVSPYGSAPNITDNKKAIAGPFTITEGEGLDNA